MNTSHAENTFIEALLDLGDPVAAAASAGVQPSLARDPRIQAALVERLRQQGPIDAVYAHKVLHDLAGSAEEEGVRFRAASLLWERGLGKTPDEVNVNVSIEQLDRASLHAEIKQLIGELGMPPLIEGSFEEVPVEQPADPPESEAPEPQPPQSEAPDPPPNEPAPSYVPSLPKKWT